MRKALLFSVFIIASCGLVYELVAGALSSYLLGDSVMQFSTVIGVYLFAMGCGSWGSKYINRALIKRFVQIELLVGVLGGFSAALLFLIFAQQGSPFIASLYGIVFIIGVLVGLEIPLVMRILQEELTLNELVSQVLTFDYLGALVVSIAFPLLLVPYLGLIRTSLVFGLLNAAVALWTTYLFRHQLHRTQSLYLQTVAVMVALSVGIVYAEQLTRFSEEKMFDDEIIFAKSTRYQRMVVTRWRDDTRLYLNGNLQFSSRDEYRYHEALIHPAMSALPSPKHVLVLGGGDGMALREILKYASVEQVTLVDLDQEMTHTFYNHPKLQWLNQRSFHSPKVRVVSEDAWLWLSHDQQFYDLIVVDFPDPTNFALGKLYTDSFYALVKQRLAHTGLAVIQSTSPLYARQSFWCIVQTLSSVGFLTAPYHAMVPSFGEWGYVIASLTPYHPPTKIAPQSLRFITPELIPSLFQFPLDMQALPSEVNRLNNQALVHYYEKEWGHQGP